MNLLVPPRCFQTRDQDGSQFGCFLGEILKHDGGQVFGFGSEAKPELSFIGLLERDLKFGAKFRFGSSDLRGAIIGCGTGTATRQLRRNGSCSRIARQRIRSFQAAKSEPACASYQIDHWPFYPFLLLLQTPSMTFHTSFSLPYSFYPSPFTFFPHGLDYSC